MLGVLLKYELKSVGRLMLPIYGAFIAVSILFGISLFVWDGSGNTDSFAGDVAISITGVIYTLLAIAIFVFTIILIIQRFYKNLLGNEGYLCFTLPVSTNAHIANKLISAVVWALCGIVVAGISMVILVLFFVTPGEIFEGIDRVFNEVLLYIGSGKFTLYAVELFAIAVLGCGQCAIKIYASIAAGQIWTSHRVLGAVAAYIVFGICEVILLNIADKICGGSFNLILTASGDYSINAAFLFIIAVQAVLVAAYWAVTYLMLDRKLNLQ